MDDLRSNVLMHVIDAKTSYNILLGKAWVHENKIVSYSYYQCLKYLKGGVERKIIINDNLFNKVESHFVDTKFYLKNYVMNEKNVDDVTKTKSDDLTGKKVIVAIKKVTTKKSLSTYNKEGVASTKKKTTHVLRYVLKVKKEKSIHSMPKIMC